MRKKILPSYTIGLATISLMTLFMASAVAADSTNRHRRSPAASRQQHSANYRVEKTIRKPRSVHNGRSVARKNAVSDSRNLRRKRNERDVSRTARASSHRDNRQVRDRDRYDRRDQRREYAYSNNRRHSFLTIFNNRHYPYRYRGRRYIPLTYHGLNYYYNNGAYYRYTGLGFSLVDNDIGIFLYSLPFGYRTLMIGGYPYYYANRHYYIRDHVRKVYVQVDDPTQADDWDDAENDSSAYQELFVYPKQGQTEQQMKRDQYECYLWAVDQSGFDPSLGKPGDMQGYQRAKSACLEGRGYVVN